MERVRYFLAAIETGSLRAAAARCEVSQPTVGQQIGALEEELDVVLLTRGKHGVRPTAAGQALLDPLRRLVAAEEELRDSAMAAGGAYHGKVRIGAVSVTAETIVAPVVGRLRKRHAGLRFTVREGGSAEVEAAVLDGELDFAVVTVPTSPAASGLHRVPLVSAPMGVYAPGDHPLAGREYLYWRDLETWPIVTMRGGTTLWELLHRNVSNPDIVVEAMTARSLKVMVAESAGLGILAKFETSADIPDLVWIPLRDAHPVRICLTHRKNTQPSRAAHIVRRLIRAKAEELTA